MAVRYERTGYYHDAEKHDEGEEQATIQPVATPWAELAAQLDALHPDPSLSARLAPHLRPYFRLVKGAEWLDGDIAEALAATARATPRAHLIQRPADHLAGAAVEAAALAVHRRAIRRCRKGSRQRAGVLEASPPCLRASCPRCAASIATSKALESWAAMERAEPTSPDRTWERLHLLVITIPSIKPTRAGGGRWTHPADGAWAWFAAYQRSPAEALTRMLHRIDPNVRPEWRLSVEYGELHKRPHANLLLFFPTLVIPEDQLGVIEQIRTRIAAIGYGTTEHLTASEEDNGKTLVFESWKARQAPGPCDLAPAFRLFRASSGWPRKAQPATTTPLVPRHTLPHFSAGYSPAGLVISPKLPFQKALAILRSADPTDAADAAVTITADRQTEAGEAREPAQAILARAGGAHTIPGLDSRCPLIRSFDAFAELYGPSLGKYEPSTDPVELDELDELDELELGEPIHPIPPEPEPWEMLHACYDPCDPHGTGGYDCHCPPTPKRTPGPELVAAEVAEIARLVTLAGLLEALR